MHKENFWNANYFSRNEDSTVFLLIYIKKINIIPALFEWLMSTSLVYRVYKRKFTLGKCLLDVRERIVREIFRYV